jgi:hypothetical protein
MGEALGYFHFVCGYVLYTVFIFGRYLSDALAFVLGMFAIMCEGTGFMLLQLWCCMKMLWS